MKNRKFIDKIPSITNAKVLTQYTFTYLNDLIKKDLNFSVYIFNKKYKFHYTYSLHENNTLNEVFNKKIHEHNSFIKGNKNYSEIIYEIISDNSSFKVHFLILSSKYHTIPDHVDHIEEILNYYSLQLNAIFQLDHQKEETNSREKGIIAVREFADLLNYLEFKDRNAFQSMFLGFTAESIGADRVTLYFYQADNKKLYPSFVMVYKNKKLFPYDFYSELKETTIKTGEDVCGIALEEKEPIHLEKLDRKIYKGIVDQKIGLKINSIISIPIIIRDNIFGVIEVANERKNKNLDEFDYYIVSIISKLAVSKIEHSQLYNWAIIDNLTQLYNFHYFQTVLDKEMARVKRHAHDLCVIMIDIDNFKVVNDTYGHPAGNIVLKTISRIIRMSIRKSIDIPIRYGGDEFLLILPETNMKGAMHLSERILESIRGHEFLLNNDQVFVTCSMGISSLKHGKMIRKEELIKKADDALYKSKNKGKNRITSDG
ncbi:MAG: GGDEF domain-containing protein [Spirochaetes bacterium]|nr:GGDEF domain-containing protein [Spirochaetota bacterium]